ncbi:MAG: hypothetical protein WKF84_19785 [Pyrinomonadaceae bacterium]
MRASGRLVALVLEEMRRLCQPGITTLEVDMAAEKLIRDAGASAHFLRAIAKLSVFDLRFGQ